MRDNRPPDQLTPDELRARIVRNSRKVLRECRQAVLDGEYWMRINPEEKPVDLEWFKIQAANARGILEQLNETLD